MMKIAAIVKARRCRHQHPRAHRHGYFDGCLQCVVLCGYEQFVLKSTKRHLKAFAKIEIKARVCVTQKLVLKKARDQRALT